MRELVVMEDVLRRYSSQSCGIESVHYLAKLVSGSCVKILDLNQVSENFQFFKFFIRAVNINEAVSDP